MFSLRCVLLLAAACGGSSAAGPGASSGDDVRIGDPHPPHAPTCEVAWLSINDSPANGHDQIAWVHLKGAGVGAEPLGADTREAVRRRVCALGGDAVSLVSSAGGQAIYLVWANSKASP